MSDTTTSLPAFTEEYRTHDRARWRDGGAWENEPDKVVWRDEATGFDALAVRNKLGNWCGYVGVTEAHPWHGMHYNAHFDVPCAETAEDPLAYCYDHRPYSEIEVHGGLTFLGRLRR